MSFYLGIDQALRKIGVCILETSNRFHLKLIKTPTGLRGTERLAFLRDSLDAITAPFKGKIRYAALENQSLGSIGDINQLGHINGITQLVISDLGVKKPLIVPPASLKKFVTGNGQASKEEMMQSTYLYWGVEINQDDLCDAYGLACMAREVMEQESMVRHQLDALYALTQPRKKRKRIKKYKINNL